MKILEYLFLGQDKLTPVAEKAGKSLEKMGEKHNKVMQSMARAAVGMGVIASAMIGKSIKDATELGLVPLQQAIKNTGENFAKVNPQLDTARAKMEKLGFTESQTNQAMTKLITSTGSSGTALSSLSTVADYATYKHMSLTEAATALSRAAGGNAKALKELGITLPPVTTSASALAAANKELRLRIAEAGGIADFAAAKHISLAKAHDLVSKATAGDRVAMAALGITIEGAQTPAERMKQVMDAMAQKIGGQAAVSAVTLGGKIRVLKATITDASAHIGLVFIPILKDMVDIIMKLVAPILHNKELMKILVIAVLGLAVAFGIASAAIFVATNLMTFGIAAAIVAVVAGVILLAKNWQRVWTDIKNWAADAYNFIYRGWGKYLFPGLYLLILVVNLVRENWRTAWNTIRDVVVSVVDVIASTIGRIIGAFNAVKNFITGNFDVWWKSHGEALKGIWKSTWDVITSVFKIAWDIISTTFKIAWNVMMVFLKPVLSLMTALIKGAFIVVSALFSVYMTILKAVFKTGWDIMTAAVKIAWAAIKLIIKSAWDTIVVIFNVAIDVLTGHWHRAWTDISNYAKQIWNNLRSFFSVQWNAIRSLAIQIFNNIKDSLRGIWNTIWANTYSRVVSGVNSVVSYIRGMIGSITNVFKNIGSLLWNAGYWLIQGFWNGIKRMWDTVVGWFKGMPSQILKALGIASPPSWAISAGNWVMKGILKGLAHGASDIGGFFKGLAGDIGGVFKSIWGTISKAFGGSAGTAGAGVQQWAGTVLKALQMLGLPASLLGNVLYQMQTESGGNPNAINLWDSNAAAGMPSQGLMQVIPPTFARWHVAGTSFNILDPLANIAAAINYSAHGAGFGSGAGQMGSGHGYGLGGLITEPIFGTGLSGRHYTFGESGNEVVLAPTGHGGSSGLGNVINVTVNVQGHALASKQEIAREVTSALADYSRKGNRTL